MTASAFKLTGCVSGAGRYRRADRWTSLENEWLCAELLRAYGLRVVAARSRIERALPGLPVVKRDLGLVDPSEALKNPAVMAVITPDDVKRLTKPFKPGRYAAGLKRPIDEYAGAVGKVRYVGEPLGAVAARDRGTAEDALELIQVDYEPLPVVVRSAEGKYEWAPMGQGIIDWVGQFRALRKDGYRGALSLETHWRGVGTAEESSRVSMKGMQQLLARAEP